MRTLIECAGHPRDMGLGQGGAARAAVRAACEAAGLSVTRSRWPSLAPLNQGPVRGRGAGRELFRHFAHQAERLEGLARAAGVPMDSVLALHLQAGRGGSEAGLLARRASLRARFESRPGPDAEDHSGPSKQIQLERTLPLAAAGEANWLVRESRPAVGFWSVEVGLPWLVPGVAGINEAGLSVMASPMLWGEGVDPSAAPSQVLVQECLQRFEDLGGALDWCEKRPVCGEQSFVLADASGALATVLSSGQERRIQQGEGELFLEGGEPVAGEEAVTGDPRVHLYPADRRLRVESPSVTLEVVLD